MSNTTQAQRGCRHCGVQCAEFDHTDNLGCAGWRPIGFKRPAPPAAWNVHIGEHGYGLPPGCSPQHLQRLD